MTETEGISSADTENPIDKPLAIAVSVIMAVVGIAVFMGIPVIVGAMTEGYGLSESEAGYITSMDLAGGTLSSLLVSALVARVNRRRLLFAGLLVAALFNVVTALVQDYSLLMVARLLAGFGGGVVYATGIALLAGTLHTGRNFSILLFAQVSVGGVELFFIPKLAASLGVEAIFAVIALAFLLSILLVPLVPSSRQAEQKVSTSEVGAGHSSAAPWLCLLAVFFFYLCVGSFWTYCERLGVDAGIDSNAIANYLTLGNLLSLLGCGLAYWLSERVGQARPLLFALASICLACLLLSGELSVSVYMFGLLAFFLFWNFTDIFQLGTLSELDHSGRYVAMVPAFQSVGSTLGPMGAAWLLGRGMNLSEILLFDAAAAALAFCCFLALFALVRKRGISAERQSVT